MNRRCWPEGWSPPRSAERAWRLTSEALAPEPRQRVTSWRPACPLGEGSHGCSFPSPRSTARRRLRSDEAETAVGSTTVLQIRVPERDVLRQGLAFRGDTELPALEVGGGPAVAWQQSPGNPRASTRRTKERRHEAYDFRLAFKGSYNTP